MKKNTYLYPLLGLIVFLTVLACGKSVTKAPQQLPSQGQPDSGQLIVKKDSQSMAPVPYPQAPVTGCSYSPNYGDTIIYPQPTNGPDFIVSPVNNPGPGKYLSWPVGMVIDSASGAIDVTKSETGQRYAIGFVKSGTTDTCLTNLVIGGADYMDSIYVAENGATKAEPYFDANPFLTSICSSTGNPSGISCAFDVTGSAASQKVIVNNSTGEIDLKRTLDGTGLLGGVFGLLPFNGETVTTTIYYRLNDASNNALQHIDLQLVYFDSRSQIGSGLLGNVLGKLDNLLSGNLISTSANPRPPLIIIVRRN
jgi:hypothetical protein